MRELQTLTPRGQVRRLRALAVEALPAWGLQGAQITPLVHAENTTFRVDRGGSRFLMRLARPGYRTPAQLDSEIEWLLSLRADGFGVPGPVAHELGYRLPRARRGVPERQIQLFHWVPGRFSLAGGRWASQRVGRLLAQLHDHARRFTPSSDFTRNAWDADTVLTEEHGLFLSWRQAGLDPNLVPFYEDVNAALHEALIDMERDGPRWLLHADLHRSNVLFHEGQANAIDFDDSGYGHPSVDAAVAAGVHWNSGFDAAWNALVDGYREVAGTCPFTREQTIAQSLARELQMFGWLADRGRDIPRFDQMARDRAVLSRPHFEDWMRGR